MKICKLCGNLYDDKLGGCTMCQSAPEIVAPAADVKKTAKKKGFVSVAEVNKKKKNDGNPDMQKKHAEYNNSNNAGDSTLSKYPIHKKEHNPGEINRFNRGVRIRSESRRRAIPIDKPTAIGGKPEINWLSLLLPPLLMLCLVFAMAYFSGSYSMVFMLPMQLITIVISIVNYRNQVKSFEGSNNLLETAYDAYLQKIRDEVIAANEKQLKLLLQDNPSPDDCIEIGIHRRSNLWERRPEDDDFGAVRLGLGNVTADVTAVWSEKGFVLEESPLEAKARELGESLKTVDNAPIVLPGDSTIIGVVGEPACTTMLAKLLALQLVTLHSYEDLRLGVIFSSTKKNDWAWARWLPHVQRPDNNKRMLADTRTGASELNEVLNQIVDERLATKVNAYGAAVPGTQYVLLVTASDLYSGAALLSKIAANPRVGIRVIISAKNKKDLPNVCSHVIELNDYQGTVYASANADHRRSFVMDSLGESSLEAFARAMAPVRLSASTQHKSIPNSVSFFEGYGLSRVEEYDLKHAWEKGAKDKSYSVPIGIDENGEVFYFDIQDRKDGVHGLVGGMSGSGKTELLQSWILSMAMHYSPQDVNFVLIDFKGTGLIGPFARLPHLAGTISNIHKATDIRRSQEALQYEITRRQTLFDEADVKDIETYKHMANNKPHMERLPVLLVVIDEYAEFMSQFPQFKTWVESSFGTCRSLGIWFILAAQDPMGAATPKILANTHFKWCLKMNNAALSKQMIGLPDAANFRHPGRCYIKVTNAKKDFTTEVQSFYSGAPYKADSGSKKDTGIAIVDLYGNHTRYGEQPSAQSDQTEIAAAVDYIVGHMQANNIPYAVKAWQDPLPERLYVHQVLQQHFNGASWPSLTVELSVPVGIVDDPKHQRQFFLEVPFSKDGHVVVYGAPSTGKTTFLQTLMMSAAMKYSPNDLHMYIMDFGGLSMSNFLGMPHVGALVETGQTERIDKLITLLQEEWNRRKIRFADLGVGNIEAFRQNCTDEIMPYILVVVDNYKALQNTAPNADAFLKSFVQSAANYGMYLVSSATGINGFNYSTESLIKTKYALQLAMTSDYQQIVGKTDGLLPDNIMGRGLIAGPPVMQFHTALPGVGESDIQISGFIKGMSGKMKDAWHGRCAPKIPELPDEIEYGTIEEPGIHIGLSVERAAPISFEYEEQFHLLISGTKGSGKSNTLKTLAMQMVEKLGAELYTMDVKGSLPELKHMGTYLRTADEIESCLDTLMPKLNQRLLDHQNGMQDFPPILMVVDDYDAFFPVVSNKTISRLNATISLCTGLGVYVLIAGECGDLGIKVNGNQSPIAACLGTRQLLLGGSISDHTAVYSPGKFANPFNPVGKNRGFYVNNDTCVMIQTMKSR